MRGRCKRAPAVAMMHRPAWGRWVNMMWNGPTRVSAVAACLLLSADVDASDPASRRIDPLLRGVGPASASDPEVAAIVRLPGLDPATRAALEAEGVRFRNAPDGRTRRLGALHPVRATKAVLAGLARRGIDVRVSRPIAMAPEVYQTAIETQAVDLRGHAPTPTQGPLGHRVVLGTFESGLDLFHPHFFRADGGAWPWVDVDEDGAFTPGIDAVDANLDGEIEASETLRLLDYGFTVGQSVEGYAGTFQTAWDYLWLDSDDSGVREFGAEGGYSESSPGYGEAMFLPDDADGDGQLSPDERIILLKTSQVAGLWGAGDVWIRGVDLVEAPPFLTFAPEASHGTCTMGIMTGGQTHPFRGNRGHVPDADIAVVAYGSGITDELMLEGMAWVTQEMGAVVVNHSWGTRGDRIHLDGTSVIDEVIDAAVEEGSVQVCSAGNRRNLGKHRALTTSEGVATFTASLPSTIFGIVPRAITFDLHWQADAGSFACTVTRPSGATHVVEEIPDGAFEELLVDAFRSDSPTGMALLSIQVSDPSDDAVGGGAWTRPARSSRRRRATTASRWAAIRSSTRSTACPRASSSRTAARARASTARWRSTSPGPWTRSHRRTTSCRSTRTPRSPARADRHRRCPRSSA
jgi:hypothetical protein